MRYFFGNLLFIIISMVFFTIYFTRFLDLQTSASSVAEPEEKRYLIQKQYDTMETSKKLSEDLQIKAKLRTGIFFLKTHKCGSSSLQNVIMRFGLKNGLDFVLPDKNNYLGNPRYFTKSMIGKSTRTLDGVYDVFTHHTRFNETSIRKIMKEDAVFITILRKPAELYESIYNYYHFEKIYQMNLTTFLENYATMGKIKRSNGSRFGLNQMCFDLGLNEKHFESSQKIKRWISKIDRAFNLVLMMEYMEESLILLADLMRWPLENVVFFNLNARKPTQKVKLNASQKKILRKLNKCDTKLQDYFFKKFKRQIQHYGVEKMKKKLEELTHLNDEFKRKCVVKTRGNSSRMVSYQVGSTFNLGCTYAVTSELSFTHLLKKIQQQRVSKLRSLKKLMKNQIEFK